MKALAIAFVIVLVAALSAVAGDDHPPLPDEPVPYPAVVRYSFRIDVVPDSNVVRGLAEVLVENRTDDSLRVIPFHTAQPLVWSYQSPEHYRSDTIVTYEGSSRATSCAIDSILYQGAPLQPEDVTVDGHDLLITLEGPIPPGESGFFLISFESHVTDLSESADFVVFNKWFPMVMDLREGTMRAVPELCDIELWLAVDSSYDFVSAGELMNHRELYSLLPEAVEDSAFVDIVNSYQPEHYGQKHGPIYEFGRKEIYVRHHHATGLPLVFGRDLKRDRMRVGTTTIEHVYHDDRTRQIPGFVCRRAADLMRLYSEWLGSLSQKNVSIISGLDPIASQHPLDPSLIVLPRRDLDDDLITGLLAVQLARLWIPPSLPDSTEDAGDTDLGIAVYLAMRAVMDLYGNDGLAMIDKTIPRLSHQLGDASTVCRIFETIPRNLHEVRFVIGDDRLWSMLTEYSHKYRYAYAPSGSLSGLANLSGNIKRDDLERLLSCESVQLDFGLTRLSIRGYDVEYELVNHGDITMPIEIAFVSTSGDTLLDTLDHERLPLPGDTALCKPSLPFDLRAIVLDPHYLLFDKDRRDNVYESGRSRGRLFPPSDLFPAYRSTTQYEDR
jgi:hypothetical protein